MTTKFPVNQFSIDSKLFPLVQNILHIGDFYPYFSRNRSRIICQAITEWYLKRRRLLPQAVLERVERGTNYYGFYEQDSMSPEALQLKFEAVLPSIAEPLRAFRYEGNQVMYHSMTNEFLNHTERVGHALAEGVDKTRDCSKEALIRLNVTNIV